LSNLESGLSATISNLLYYISGYIYTKIGACITIRKIFQLTTWTIVFLHTDVSVRAYISCRPLLIISKEKGVVAELWDTVAKHRSV